MWIEDMEGFVVKLENLTREDVIIYDAMAAGEEKGMKQGMEQGREQGMEAVFRAAVESGVDGETLKKIAAAVGITEKRAAEIIGEVNALKSA